MRLWLTILIAGAAIVGFVGGMFFTVATFCGKAEPMRLRGK